MTGYAIVDSSNPASFFYLSSVSGNTKPGEADANVSSSNGSSSDSSVPTYIPSIDPAYLAIFSDITLLMNTMQEAAGSFDIFSVLRMIEAIELELKQAMREGRLADAQGAYTEAMNQAAETRQAATDRFIGDLISSVIGAVVGCVGVGVGLKALGAASSAEASAAKAAELKAKKADIEGGLANAKKDLDSLKASGKDPARVEWREAEIASAEKNLKKVDAEIKQAEQTSAAEQGRSQSLAMNTNAITMLGQAVGGIAKAVGDYTAGMCDAQKAEDAARQAMAEYARDAGAAMMDSIQKVFDSALQAIEAIEAARQQSFTAIAAR